MFFLHEIWNNGARKKQLFRYSVFDSSAWLNVEDDSPKSTNADFQHDILFKKSCFTIRCKRSTNFKDFFYELQTSTLGP